MATENTIVVCKDELVKNQPVLLCDLDGVLRSFDRVNRKFDRIAQEYELPPNAMMNVAFEPQLLELAITGKIAHGEWVQRVSERLINIYGKSVSDLLVECWTDDRGEVVHDVLAVVKELRTGDWRVVLATNATTRLEEDLLQLGLHDELDDIVNSSDIGIAKPNTAYYVFAQKVTKAPVSQILFVDDKPTNVTGAKTCSITGVIFENADRLRESASAFAANVLD